MPPIDETFFKENQEEQFSVADDTPTSTSPSATLGSAPLTKEDSNFEAFIARSKVDIAVDIEESDRDYEQYYREPSQESVNDLLGPALEDHKALIQAAQPSVAGPQVAEPQV